MKKQHIITFSIIILLDQIAKILVIFFLEVNQEIPLIGNVFKIHYVLNDGLAMNTSLDISNEKLVLTLFRLVLIVGGFFYYWIEVRLKYRQEIILSFIIFIAGAFGNFIDNIFYGLWFNITSPGAPMLFLHGQVVDMFHIDIWHGELAQLGNRYFTIFPIFNIADLAMFVGFGLVFYYWIKFGKNMQISR